MSSVTEPAAARLRVEDVAALQEIASRLDTTVSTVIREVIAAADLKSCVAAVRDAR